MCEMKSSGVDKFAPFEDLVDALDTSDRIDGVLTMDLGIDLDDVFLSFSGRCFLTGESPLPQVNVLLKGRSRLEERPLLAVSSLTLRSSAFSSRERLLLLSVDFADFFSVGSV
jgi:hypothetical protein